MPTSCTGSDNWVAVDESDAIDRSKHGDGDAFATLVTRYQDIAFRTAYMITGDAADAEDAAQTGFVKAWFGLRSFRPGAAFRPWLLTIVANEARNRRTAKSRHPQIDLDVVQHEVQEGGSCSPDELAIIAERDRTLFASINRLSVEDRVVIAYRYFLELNEAEMAAALGCRSGTVKSRLSRAMARLRVQITNQEEAALE